MEKELFFEKIKDKVDAHFGDRAEVKRNSVVKNNGLKKEGLLVRVEESNCAPTIYMDEYYDEFVEGKLFDDIVDEICDMFEKYIVPENVDISFFQNIEEVRSLICYRLVSGEKNEEELSNMPHRYLNNLAVTYFVALEKFGIEGTIGINNAHAEFWGVTEEDLYEMAMDNTPRLFPAEVVPISKMMDSILNGMSAEENDLYDEVIDNPSGLYVASNDKKLKGASVILYPGLLREVYESLGGAFYIIPSSIHEVIFLKDIGVMDKDEIEHIIRSVNTTCIREEDYLSDNVYYYDGDGENNVKMLEEGSRAMVL